MPEKLNFKVSVGQEKMSARRILTLGQAIDLIKGKGYPAEIEQELIKNISKQPSNTFESFLKSISKQIARIQKDKNDGKDKA